MVRRRIRREARTCYVSEFNKYLVFRELFRMEADEEFLSVNEVREKIGKRIRRKFVYGTVHGILKKGENSGQCWATWRSKEGVRKQGDRRLRVYSLTDKGKKFVSDFAKKVELQPTAC